MRNRTFHDQLLQVTVSTEDPIGQIHSPPWMTASEAQTVLDALSADGHVVRFIGGCVRDAILKRPVKDIDLALAAPPEAVMALLQRAAIRAIPTGIAHGTVTAVVGGKHFEVTSLRVDIETDGRHARVAFTDDWVADAARRDFTINAMSCTTDGKVYDYFGGLEDLSSGTIRFVGDARERIREDALRILRFFRIYAWYGLPPADPDALHACQELAADVLTLTGERVRDELLRLLMADTPAEVLRMMRETGVLQNVLPWADQDFDRIEKVCWLETRALAEASVRPDAIRRLAALLDAGDQTANAVADRLKLSNRQRAQLSSALSGAYRIDPHDAPLSVKRALYHLGKEKARDVAILTWADELARSEKRPRSRTDAWTRALREIDAWRPISFPLTGDDALSLNIPRGPDVGKALKAVEAWWEEGGFKASRDECLDQLRLVVSNRS